MIGILSFNRKLEFQTLFNIVNINPSQMDGQNLCFRPKMFKFHIQLQG